MTHHRPTITPRLTTMPNKPQRYRPSLPSRPSPSEAARPSAHERGYNSRWQRFRLSYLADHPLCVPCSTAGRTVEATRIDHIDGKGPLGDRGYDETNLVAMCASCHSKKTNRADGGGFGHNSNNG